MTGLQQLSDNLVKISLLVVVRDLQGLSDADSTYRKNRKRSVIEAGDAGGKKMEELLSNVGIRFLFGCCWEVFVTT